MLGREDILKLAKLSRLSLPEAEIESVSGHIGDMLSHMETLRQLDLSSVEPMTGVEEGETILREDIPQPSLSYRETFMNAPAVENDQFAIPKVIGG
ncbi:MAG: Asp-tRNA(Asn)/Glu-tRNA(Gln) amidotransferase subunit GatC [Fibrobacter sp.]|jgi:aspartyl-tRNA(Asn)/glutamyl-tRNA(Gln) amidotransferase subunit C|nr:Asp-tRNA(Asn)/Glu-tRNA(Gln) amidotransferase subunit GatC [Fibrobacter sp.]